MYLLIGIWGDPRRRIYAAIKFFLFTMAGSVLMLVAILILYFINLKATGKPSFDVLELYKLSIPATKQYWLFAAFALAFAIKVPMFPFHTWLPDAHAEAPTAGSVILAGVLLKMGTYGFIRFATPLFPKAAYDFLPLICALALMKGAYTLEGDTLTVEVRLFDVYQRRQLTGRRYHGSVGELRRMANKFADEIMLQFTGERGPFDSRLAFASTRDGKFKEIYVMSLDGGDLQQVTKTQTINVSPSWSPDNRSLLFTSYKRGNPDLYFIDLRTST